MLVVQVDHRLERVCGVRIEDLRPTPQIRVDAAVAHQLGLGTFHRDRRRGPLERVAIVAMRPRITRRAPPVSLRPRRQGVMAVVAGQVRRSVEAELAP
jgi:hypothetical protein